MSISQHLLDSTLGRFCLVVAPWIAGVLSATPLQAAPPLPGDQLNIPGFEKYVFKTFTGATGQEQNLYVYVCKPEGWKASDSRGAAVYIHGGGYEGGDPAEGANFCRYFAGRGMVTFTIEYRISSRDAAKEEMARWDFWKPRSDCIEAIRWIRSRASTFGIAPDRIAVGGWSAGVDATMSATFGWKHVPAEFPCGDPNVSSVPDAAFLENGALAEIVEGNWYTRGDPVPPILLLKDDTDGITPSPEGIVSNYFNTVFADQPYKEIREYRRDIAPDGSTRCVAGHACFLPGLIYCRAATIDLEEWFATLGFLPNRSVPPLAESDGVCRIEAEDFSDRYPRILQNSPNTLRWQINYAKDASEGYLMDCVPPSELTIDDAAIPKAPRLDYRIKISTPGKYYVWANIRASWEASRRANRGAPEGPYFFRSKQLRLGVSDGQSDPMLSGRLVTTPDGIPSWQRPDVADPIVVSSPGFITLKAYATSAGIRLDQIILTTDASYVPPATPSPAGT